MNGELSKGLLTEKSEAIAEDGRNDSIALNIPPMGCVLMKDIMSREKK
jgi:hypothetical protein